ncbi:hypothetical protein [Nocardioides bruguierae]|uniref:Uncharacterized protein n=1 Tax=Nocardioides bruguierae TaxID=2945102 RepID=A0A9X2IG30_9ACTN|nr:hypothetical protein [Nocardioides bruguierae]MCL8023971.1 hypothetical protein [Nocardioides bruguierae]MCM0620365.1 hypothetical protein [Nocardioides bruguierae]
MARFKPSEDHPVLVGLVALVGVAVAIGLVLGVVALAGSRVAGLGETSTADSTADVSAGETLYAPRPTRTSATSEPSEETSTASSGGGSQGDGGSAKKNNKKKQKQKRISLSASPQQVSSMERIDLTGTYKGGEGSVLQVQRLQDGSWTDFPVTAVVSGGTFSTYVQTGYAGEVKFRVLDSDSDRTSNTVTVTVG